MSITQERLHRVLTAGEDVLRVLDTIRGIGEARGRAAKIMPGDAPWQAAYEELVMMLISANLTYARVILAEERVRYQFTHARNDSTRERKTRVRRANGIMPQGDLGPLPTFLGPLVPHPGDFSPLADEVLEAGATAAKLVAAYDNAVLGHDPFPKPDPSHPGLTPDIRAKIAREIEAETRRLAAKAKWDKELESMGDSQPAPESLAKAQAVADRLDREEEALLGTSLEDLL